MKIPVPFSELYMDCPECSYRETPDMILGHLIMQHGNNVARAEEAIQNWMNGFDLNDKGEPLAECEFHGTYNLMSGCPGCEVADVQIQVWKETR